MNSIHILALGVALLLAACAETAQVEKVGPTAPPSEVEDSAPQGGGPSGSSVGRAEEILTTDDRPPGLRAATAGWGTDWLRHTVPYDEIISGGPPRDGIPSLDDPQFVNFDSARAWLADTEPVIALEIEGDARAYPLQILTWHEIVNDQVGSLPVVVTFCPLCNSALVFDRRVSGQVYAFGTSGLLRHSDLIMYDRTTESLWQQFTGRGIVGAHAGDTLTFIPASIISFADFRAAYPDGKVLSRETGYQRSYGTNPYAGYDSAARPFLFRGELDERLPAMLRVVGIVFGDTAVAYPYSVLAEVGVVNDTVGGQAIVIFHRFGTTSALGEAQIAQAEDVGATGVFDPNVDGQKLTFVIEDGHITDQQTGSLWNLAGQATAGPLAGEWLIPLVHSDHFWFSWAAFYPETAIYEGE